MPVADPGGGGGAQQVRAPLFSPNTFKNPLNWLKFTKKILGGKPPKFKPRASDPGSATWRHGFVTPTKLQQTPNIAYSF